MSRAPFKVHIGVAAPLRVDNVDTDQIIPSREMKSVSREGLADGLFAGWRYTEPGGRTPRADFVLNRPDYDGASILLAGVNFGCGSSREHAVWALAEFGIRAVLAESFGEIFRGNCVRNGVAPLVLPGEALAQLAAHVARDPQSRLVAVDLPAQTVSTGPYRHGFDIAAFDKRLLVEGLDPIGLTLEDRGAIDAFEARDRAARPWIYEV